MSIDFMYAQVHACTPRNRYIYIHGQQYKKTPRNKRRFKAQMRIYVCACSKRHRDVSPQRARAFINAHARARARACVRVPPNTPRKALASQFEKRAVCGFRCSWHSRFLILCASAFSFTAEIWPPTLQPPIDLIERFHNEVCGAITCQVTSCHVNSFRKLT